MSASSAMTWVGEGWPPRSE